MVREGEVMGNPKPESRRLTVLKLKARREKLAGSLGHRVCEVELGAIDRPNKTRDTPTCALRPSPFGISAFGFPSPANFITPQSPSPGKPADRSHNAYRCPNQ